ncbi:L,D-transpeptidase [Dysgonomonas sp. 216]|uniref:L,D-transpeptidase family protein n=1 Tax=Dysgonomonas sp. 216 TaxID=2302934 RepID=UPI0013D7BD5B|nr:L,D-transpeptidase family protein [Dysgonomonas sp. 216]NDW17959.1 L,D-transpeptidase [Dysgonomonas sp. 216]
MNKHLRIFILLLSINSIVTLNGCNTSSNTKQQQEISDFPFPELNTDIAEKLEGDTSVLSWLYKQNGYSPIWISKDIDLQKIRDVLSIFDESYMHGLSPELFNKTTISQIVDSINNNFYIWDDYLDTALRLELLLSESALKYSTILQFGYLAPQNLYPEEYHIEIRKPDSAFYTNAFKQLANNQIELLTSSQPQCEVYKSMQKSLLKWSSLQDSTFATIANKGKNNVYKLKEKSNVVATIGHRLSLSGEYIKPDTMPDIIDEQLIEAVNAFRKLNSYPESEEIDKLVIDAMNRPLSHYCNKLIANMERYRWKRVKGKSAKNIEVNVAGAYLVASDKDASPLQMKVCVGQPSTPTPLIENEVGYLNINPLWNVPKSIAQKEICVIMKRDSTYLARKNMRLYKGGEEVDPSTIDWKTVNCSQFYYEIRQDAGDFNSLGRIKFMFPNRFAVYLHDTPSKLTFKRKNRAVSHGCVRVEKPLDLAYYCTSTASDEVYQDRIRYSIDRSPVSKQGKELLKNGKLQKLPDIINLKSKIPVSIDYYTVYMLPNDSTLYFADDVYGYDDIILKNMDNKN